MEIDQFMAGERLRLRGEDKVPDMRDALAFTHAHVDLAGRSIHAYFARLLEERRVEGIFATHLQDRVLDVRIRNNRGTGDFGLLA